jgi:hypothetical protein
MKFFVEISETLESLVPKSQNARYCNLRLAGGAMKEVVHIYVLFSPNVQVSSAENPHKGRSYEFSGNPRRAVRFLQKRERMDEIFFVQWVLQELCSDTMLIFL